LDFTVLYLAVPVVTEDLRPSASQLLWIVDIYGFLSAGLLITMGTLGDRIGRRKLLLLGAAGFSVASVLAAFATSAELLIVARGLLGIAGATLSPSTLSLIRNMFLDERERAFAVGVWVACFAGGAVIGPLVGGVLLDHFWWGSVFVASVPAMALVLILGPIILPEFKNPDPGRMDALSAGLSISAVLLTISGIKLFAEGGPNWTSAAAVLLGVGLGLVFVDRQRRLAEPLVDLSLFRLPAFSASLIVNILAVFIVFSMLALSAQYFQLVAGLSARSAGLLFVLSGLVLAIASLAVPVLVAGIGPARTIAGGFLMGAAGLLWLWLSGGPLTVWVVLVGMIVMSAGIAPLSAVTTNLVLASAPPERAGSAASVSETSLEFGGALGIAITGSIAVAIYRARLAAAMPPGLPSPVAADSLDTLGGALAAARPLPPEIGAPLIDAARSAFSASLVATAGICAALAILAAVLALRRKSDMPGD
jgi:DHA2 family multidrug resistance protein-like MFS transporter